MLKLWERLVNIDSGTGDEQGLKEVGAIAMPSLPCSSANNTGGGATVTVTLQSG